MKIIILFIVYKTFIGGMWNMDLRLKAPSCIIISGGSNCGKTFLIEKLLSKHEQCFEKPINNYVGFIPNMQKTKNCSIVWKKLISRFSFVRDTQKQKYLKILYFLCQGNRISALYWMIYSLDHRLAKVCMIFLISLVTIIISLAS